MVSIPDTYRKVVVTEPNIDFRKATEIVEVPMPELAPDEVLVKNYYAGVNASDINISAGVYSEGKPLPLDTGVEAAGEIVAVGSAVTDFEVGDPVVTSLFSGIGKGYREYFVAKPEVLIPAPDLVPGVLCLPIAAGTAHLALYTVGEMSEGDEVVLITAAAGGVGHLAVQLAKLAGNHVIGTCGSPRKAQMLHDLGVDRVINYREEDVGAVISAEYPEQLTLVMENVGKMLFDVAVDNLATRGRLVINGYISEYKSQPDIIESARIYYKLLWKSASLRGFLMPHYLDDLGAALDDIFRLYDEDKLTPIHDPTAFRGVEEVADAVEHLHSGQNAGKVVVTF
jgi:hypothetical protein